MKNESPQPEHDTRCVIDPGSGDYKEGVDPDNTNFICNACIKRAMNVAVEE